MGCGSSVSNPQVQNPIQQNPQIQENKPIQRKSSGGDKHAEKQSPLVQNVHQEEQVQPQSHKSVETKTVEISGKKTSSVKKNQELTQVKEKSSVKQEEQFKPEPQVHVEVEQKEASFPLEKNASHKEEQFKPEAQANVEVEQKEVSFQPEKSASHKSQKEEVLHIEKTVSQKSQKEEVFQPEKSVSHKEEQLEPEPMINVEMEQKEVTFAPEKNESERPRQEHEYVYDEGSDGMQFWRGGVSNKIRQIVVKSETLKSNIPLLEKTIQDNKADLTHINVSFNPDETDNVDYFISKVLTLAPFLDVQFTFEKLATFTPEGLVNMGQCLAELPLNKLFIQNWGTDTTDKLFEDLKVVKKTNKHLKTLVFYTPDTPQVTDQTFAHIKDMLEGADNLEEYNVCLEGSQATDKAMETVKETLKGKNNLQTLFLGFNNCKELTDKALKEVEEMIADKKNLKRLIFNASGVNFSEDAFTALTNVANARGFEECDVRK